MRRKIRTSYPVMAQAFGSPDPSEQGPTIEGCSKEDCGAWGSGVCRITVKVPDEIKVDNPAMYKSQTVLSELGCITCGGMEGFLPRGNTMLAKSGGAIPLGMSRETNDAALLFKAGDLALPGAMDAICQRTQCEVEFRT